MESHPQPSLEVQKKPSGQGLAQENTSHLLTVKTVSGNTIKIHNAWLRDHCMCAQCINQNTLQRQLASFSPEILHAEIVDIRGLNSNSPTVQVEWNHGHQSTYEKSWITESFTNSKDDRNRKGEFLLRNSWPDRWQENINADSTLAALPHIQFKELEELKNRTMAQWMESIRAWGFALVLDTPSTPSATRELLERIGPVRNTHFGSFYDVTADLSSKDTAYTTQSISPHNDTTYFSDPVKLQAFHILSHSDGKGGATQLVDGYRVAEELRDEDRKILEEVKLYAHSSGNDGVSIVGEPFSILEYDKTGLKRVRWNNEDRAGFEKDVLMSGIVDKWYSAAATWDKLVNTRDPRWWINLQLKPGMLLVFDNWRVLHGRSAFTGKRRLYGAYINRDDYVSRWKNEVLGRDAVLQKGIY